MNKYYHRRRWVSALVVSTSLFLLDQTSSAGSKLPVISAWSVFALASFLPLVIATILDEFGDPPNER